MKKWLFTLCFALLAPVSALTLDQTLAKAPSLSPVLLAQLELENAQRELERQLKDPLITRLVQTQAEQRLVLAKSKLAQAEKSAALSLVEAYTNSLEAQSQVELAQKALELAQKALEIAQIRKKNGSATSLDLQSAENSLLEAKKNLKASQDGQNLANSNLQSLTKEESLPTEPELPVLPDGSPEALAAQIRALPSWVGLSQGVELAQLQVNLLDPSYASRSQIEAAQTQLGTLQNQLLEAERGLKLQLQGLYNQVSLAWQTTSIQAENLKKAQDQLANEKKRLEAGLISQFQFLQAELNSLQAQTASNQARHVYIKAVFTLAAGGR